MMINRHSYLLADNKITVKEKCIASKICDASHEKGPLSCLSAQSDKRAALAVIFLQTYSLCDLSADSVVFRLD